MIDEDGILYVIFIIWLKDGERKYVVEVKNGKFYYSVIVVCKVCWIRKVIYYIWVKILL